MKPKADWYTVPSFRENTTRIKRSVFTCCLKEVETAEAARLFIRKISRENPQATHNCWAYIVGDNGEIFHSSDAGEPAGTAGAPMLQALQKNHMTNTAVVVTRYFGGVKLGIRGLIEAYRESVQNTIDTKPLKKIRRTVAAKICIAYDINDMFTNRLDPDKISITHTEYTDIVTHHALIDQDAIHDLFNEFELYRKSGKFSVDLENR